MGVNCGFSEYERKTVNDNYLIYKAAEEWIIDCLWNFIFAIQILIVIFCILL